MCIKRERRQDNIFFVIHFHFRCMRHYIKTKMCIIFICSNLIFFCSKISWRYSGANLFWCQSFSTVFLLLQNTVHCTQYQYILWQIRNKQITKNSVSLALWYNDYIQMNNRLSLMSIKNFHFLKRKSTTSPTNIINHIVKYCNKKDSTIWQMFMIP